MLFLFFYSVYESSLNNKKNTPTVEMKVIVLPISLTTVWNLNSRYCMGESKKCYDYNFWYQDTYIIKNFMDWAVVCQISQQRISNRMDR